jgi:hypothetical protein
VASHSTLLLTACLLVHGQQPLVCRSVQLSVLMRLPPLDLSFGLAAPAGQHRAEPLRLTASASPVLATATVHRKDSAAYKYSA